MRFLMAAIMTLALAATPVIQGAFTASVSAEELDPANAGTAVVSREGPTAIDVSAQPPAPTDDDDDDDEDDAPSDNDDSPSNDLNDNGDDDDGSPSDDDDDNGNDNEGAPVAPPAPATAPAPAAPSSGATAPAQMPGAPRPAPVQIPR